MQKLELPINLAISLHAVRNELRSELMPVNQGFPFPDVIAAAEEYAVSSGRQVTYEYILLADINDSDRDAELLAEYLRYKQAGVNLIPANPVPEKGYFRPKMQRIRISMRPAGSCVLPLPEKKHREHVPELHRFAAVLSCTDRRDCCVSSGSDP